MPTPATVFDANMDRWTDEQRMPWNRLKYTVVQHNLQRHLGPAPLRILDAGGGNGYDSLPLAAAGHSVTIVDYSAEMLADAGRSAEAIGVQIATHHTDLLALPELFPEACFDVVLCHNVLQYVDDVPALLRAITAPLVTGGLLSLMSVNRYAMPYLAALFHDDLVDAYRKIDQRTQDAILFGTPMQQYAADEISVMLGEAGCVLENDYGIRCLCDYWGDNARKSDPFVHAQLERLELALTDRHPYKLLARFFQIVARKQP